jgi:outer membrane cobalamin receptor
VQFTINNVGMRVHVASLLCWLAATSASAAVVSGRVVDVAGAPLPGVAVTAEGPVTREATSASDGTFSFVDLPAGAYELAARLEGFARWTGRVAIDDGPAPGLHVTLLPRPFSDTIVVTASRGAARTGDPAAPVSVVASSTLANAPSPALDDALRATPGFSLFRRTSSRTANPTTQGATLRGLAASGASRALVLADGVVLNDPFGGWVYWNRVPQAAIDRVEVVRGAASDLYGADALGGVVQVLTAPASATRNGRLVLDGDTSATARASLFGAGRRGAWSGSAAGEASRTDGSFVVDDDTRGAVDQRAGGDYLTGRVSGGVDGRGWRARAHGAAFGESRRNGTVLQLNDTSLRQVTGDVAGPVGPGFLEASGTGGDQDYHQSFSSVASDRTSETLTSRQTVPTTAARASVAYRIPVGAADVLAGFDTREVWAASQDVAYFPSGVIRSTTKTPGYDNAAGVYAQFRTPIGSRASVTAGIRNDWWRRESGGDAVSVASPRLSASFRLTPHLVARGSVGRAFRAPTINERIRPFRAGNVLTLANAGLEPERVTLYEGGVSIEGARGSLRTAVFTSVVDDAVTNVTVSFTPQLITRQRRNAARVRATGAEAEGDVRLASPLWLTGALAVTSSTYEDTPGLSGNDVPQVPHWQATMGARWQAPAGVMVQGFVRGIGAQFEDDRNTLVLRRATLVDVTASRPFGRRMSLVAAVENLFDVDYDTGRTPTRTIGTPITARVAVRLAY